MLEYREMLDIRGIGGFWRAILRVNIGERVKDYSWKPLGPSSLTADLCGIRNQHSRGWLSSQDCGTSGTYRLGELPTSSETSTRPRYWELWLDFGICPNTPRPRSLMNLKHKYLQPRPTPSASQCVSPISITVLLLVPLRSWRICTSSND